MQINAGQAAAARELLENHLVFRQGDPSVYKMLSHASEASGDKVSSHIYMADYNEIIGDYSRAISHLEAALRRPMRSYHEEAGLQARLKTLRQQNSGIYTSTEEKQ
jgi:predicted Zn-dependent protease